MTQKTLYATTTSKLCVFREAISWLKPDRLVKKIETVSSTKAVRPKHY